MSKDGNFLENPPFSLPIPEEATSRIKAFVYDLAYGVVNNYWRPTIVVSTNGQIEAYGNLEKYLEQKWAVSNYPDIRLLSIYRYLENITLVGGPERFQLTEKALTLLENAPEASIFISYNRYQSSAFALLVLQVLKREGLGIFLDIRSIAPGDNWHGLIEEEVKKRENFICLLGSDTLQSPYVRKEIRWAAQDKGKKRIIPIFHNNFKPDDFKDDEFQDLLTYNAIVVTEETAIAYESALLQLLNYFGRTP